MRKYILLLFLLTVGSNAFAVTTTDYYNAGSKFYSDKNYPQAIRYYDAALQMNPHNASALIGRANCYYSKKLFQHALTDYRKAHVLQPENPEVNQFIKALQDLINSASSTITWLTPAEGLAESQRTQKPILYDITAEWCGYCKMLKRDVFENGPYAARINLLFVPVRVLDRKHEDGHNPEEVAVIEAKYKNSGFPTLVVQFPGKADFHKFSGYGGKTRMMKFLNKSVE